MTSWRELARWIRRSGVPPRDVVRSVATAMLAQLASHTLAIGAPLLLLMAWSQRDWSNPLQRIALPLVIVEVLAFLRSPLRYLDRMSTHRLGVSAVTTWRQWLTEQVSRWSFRTYSTTSRAQLLQQSVVDVDSLQDIWLRIVVPLTSSLMSYLVAAGVAVTLTSLFVDAAALTWLTVGVVITTLLTLAALSRCLPHVVASLDEMRQVRARALDDLYGRQQLALELTLLRDGSTHGETSPHPSEAQWRVLQSRLERWWRRIDLALAGCASALVVVAGTISTTAALRGPGDVRVVNVGVLGVLLASISGELFATWRGGLEAAADVILTGRDLTARGTPVSQADTQERWPAVATQFEIPGVLRFTPGQIVAVVGESGSGKSTWLREVARLDSGTAALRINERDLSSLSEEELRDHVVHVATEPRFLGMRLTDEIVLGRRDAPDFPPIVESLRLSVDPAVRPTRCSRGERYRYAVARALVRQPDLLLLDEPTSALGDEERTALIELLRSQSCAVILATHDAAVIAQCDYVVAIESLIG